MRRYIPCYVSSGMFPDEYSVKVEDQSGDIFSLFVDKGQIIEKNSKHLLKILLIDHDSGTISLPNETIEGGFRRLQVRPSAVMNHDPE